MHMINITTITPIIHDIHTHTTSIYIYRSNKLRSKLSTCTHVN